MPSRIFLFTGHAGLEKGALLDRLVQASRTAEHWPEDYIRAYTLEKYLPDGIDVPGFLDVEDPPEKKREGWTKALIAVRDKIAQDNPHYALVAVHACFFRNNRFFSFVEPASLGILKPTAIITLIDDVYHVWPRVNRREEALITGSYFTLLDLMHWRWAEVMMSDYFALTFGIRNYMVAVKHPALMLHRLLFRRRDYMPVYACIPITEPRRSAEKRREVNRYRVELHTRYTVFDPLTIDEKILSFLLTKQHPGWHRRGARSLYGKSLVVTPGSRWPTVFSSRPELQPLHANATQTREISLDAGEAVEVCRAKSRFLPPVKDPKSITDSVVDQHIRFRDFRLIDDCFAVPAYRPQFEGNPPGGQAREVQYAQKQGKRYVVYHDSKRDGTLKGGPFPDIPGKVVLTKQELFRRLDQFQEEYKKRQEEAGS